jgi:hypothetical protein
MLLHPLVTLLPDHLLGLHHEGGEALHEERVGAIGLESDGLVVHHLDALDLRVVASSGHLLGRVQHAIEGRLDVLGGERGAVVELDALAELHLPRGVVQRLPGGGEVRPHLARLEVPRRQVVEDVVAQDDRLAQHRVGRVPRVHVRLQRVDDGVVLGLRSRGRDGADRREEQGGEHERE